jgi:hypothetical protein
VKIKAYILCVVVAISLTSTKSAAQHPDQWRLPINNLAELYAFAKTQVRDGYVAVGGGDIAENSTNITSQYLSFGAKNTETQIAEKIRNTVLTFTTVGSQDLMGYGGLRDTRGYQSFGFQAGLDRVWVGDRYLLRAKEQARFRIADEIFIPYPGAFSVQFVKRDSEGNVFRSYSMKIVEGGFMFKVGLAGDVELYEDDDLYADSNSEVHVFVDTKNGYREDTYNNGWYQWPELTQGSVTPEWHLIDRLPDDTLTVRGVTHQDRPDFLMGLRLTKDQEVTIYPSIGKDVKGKGDDSDIITIARKGAIILGDGTFWSEFWTTENDPARFQLPAGDYYIINCTWDSPRYGEGYHEWHYVQDDSCCKGGTITASTEAVPVAREK